MSARLKREKTRCGSFGRKFNRTIVSFISRCCPSLERGVRGVRATSPLACQSCASAPSNDTCNIMGSFRGPLVALFPTEAGVTGLLLAKRGLGVRKYLKAIISTTVAYSRVLKGRCLSGGVRGT